MSADQPDTDPGFPRMLERGRAFVYVVPCRDDTLFKIGFSRDPLQRWRTLHRRFFDFFDLDQGVLVGVERVSEARRIERLLLKAFADYQALAPLLVSVPAAGHNEWFRGVLSEVVTAAEDEALRSGLTVFRPPAAWLRAALLERRNALFGWTQAVLNAIEFERHNPAGGSVQRCLGYERALVDALDAYRSVGLDVEAYLHEAASRFRCRNDRPSAIRHP